MLHFYETHEKAIMQQARELLPMFRECYKLYGGNALVQNAHELCQHALDKSGLWEQTSCKNACSFCCHDTIHMTKLEADYIRAILKLNKLRPNQERTKLQKENPKEKLNFMQRACPLLRSENENGQRLCSIYEARPLICRTHNSADDPKYCNRVDYPTKQVKEGRAVQTEAIGMALVLLEQELGLQGKMPKMVAMHNL